jgi:hypothetical protein
MQCDLLTSMINQKFSPRHHYIGDLMRSKFSNSM